MLWESNKLELDWIIFEYDHLYLPQKITNRNKNNNQGLKTFRIFIGDGDEWHSFNPKMINVEKNNTEQSFLIDCIDHNLVKKKQFKQMKVKFIKNHGCTLWSDCRFRIKEIRLFGLLH